MVKMNKSNEDDIVCPLCDSSEISDRIYNITINDTPLLLHDEVGEIYQCMNPECRSYLEKVNSKIIAISKSELIRRQKDITDLLVAEREIALGRRYPKAVEFAATAEISESLSGVLYTMTVETDFHRAYTIEELFEACAKLGYHPSKVDNVRIPYVLSWLKEYKD